MNATLDKLQKQKADLVQQVNKLVNQHKALYSNIDISEPKSIEEKESEARKAALFSQINSLVQQIRAEKKRLQIS